MNKLIAFSALVALLAIGCSSQSSRGGSEDVQSNAKYGGAEGSITTSTNAFNSATNSAIDPTISPKTNSVDSTLPAKTQKP